MTCVFGIRITDGKVGGPVCCTTGRAGGVGVRATGNVVPGGVVVGAAGCTMSLTVMFLTMSLFTGVKIGTDGNVLFGIFGLVP